MKRKEMEAIRDAAERFFSAEPEGKPDGFSDSVISRVFWSDETKAIRIHEDDYAVLEPFLAHHRFSVTHKVGEIEINVIGNVCSSTLKTGEHYYVNIPEGMFVESMQMIKDSINSVVEQYKKIPYDDLYSDTDLILWRAEVEAKNG